MREFMSLEEFWKLSRPRGISGRDWERIEIAIKVAESLRAEVERLKRKNRMHDTVNRDQAESYEKRLEAAEQKAAELQARVDALDAGYTEAIEDISEWAAYASEYFQSKHDLEGCISRHKARLINALNLQHKPTETDLTTKD